VVDDLAWSFAERWRDPNPLDTRNPLRSVLHRVANHPDTPGALPASRPATPDGPLAVQVLRTYPARRRAYPFAPEGERSIARAYLKAFARARRLVYLEDQYLWSLAATEALRHALAHNPDLQVAIVVPRYPDPDGAISGEASRIGRERVLDALHEVGHERVAVYDVENREGTPIYVHSKVCIVDDVWMAVGSDNLNRRSWTHDSELSCSVIDSRRDARLPTDPAGLGDGARVLARDTRIRLAAEHLGRAPDDVDDLVDPASWFEALRKGANALDSWHRLDGVGERPPGHLREHPFERVRGSRRVGRGLIHATLLDPDGRPKRLRRRNAF
jgi:phosphatidylserine/phosphatidylglycerophosphate/cardiolipin synthase-like enzyme